DQRICSRSCGSLHKTGRAQPYSAPPSAIRRQTSCARPSHGSLSKPPPPPLRWLKVLPMCSVTDVTHLPGSHRKEPSPTRERGRRVPGIHLTRQREMCAWSSPKERIGRVMADGLESVHRIQAKLRSADLSAVTEIVVGKHDRQHGLAD